MNLREKLAALVEKAKAAKTMDELESVAAEIEEVKSQIELADAKQARLKAMEVPVAKAAAPSRGLAEQLKAAGASRTQRFSATVKAAGDPNKLPSGDAAILDTEVREDVLPGARRALTVADLFGQETTGRDAVTYFTEGPADGEPAKVDEGGAFPKISFGDPVKHTDAVEKIGCIYKDTNELLDDLPRLAESLADRANYLMDLLVEDTLVGRLLETSGLQVDGTASTLELLVERIKAAKAGVKKNTPGFVADAVLVNDDDWDGLTSLKDKNGQFLVGGPYTGQYGNGAVQESPAIWGLKVVPTQAVPEGTCVVGAFKQGASVIRNGGRVVEMTNSNDTDFEKGLISFRPSERLAFAVRYPAAFVKVTGWVTE